MSSGEARLCSQEPTASIYLQIGAIFMRDLSGEVLGETKCSLVRVFVFHSKTGGGNCAVAKPTSLPTQVAYSQIRYLFRWFNQRDHHCSQLLVQLTDNPSWGEH